MRLIRRCRRTSPPRILSPSRSACFNSSREVRMRKVAAISVFVVVGSSRDARAVAATTTRQGMRRRTHSKAPVWVRQYETLRSQMPAHHPDEPVARSGNDSRHVVLVKLSTCCTAPLTNRSYKGFLQHKITNVSHAVKTSPMIGLRAHRVACFNGDGKCERGTGRGVPCSRTELFHARERELARCGKRTWSGRSQGSDSRRGIAIAIRLDSGVDPSGPSCRNTAARRSAARRHRGFARSCSVGDGQ